MSLNLNNPKQGRTFQDFVVCGWLETASHTITTAESWWYFSMQHFSWWYLSISGISQLIRTQFWPNFEGRFLGPFLKDTNCHGDQIIVFGPNIFWPNLFLDPNFLDTKFFGHRKYFDTKFFWTQIFWTVNFLRLKIYLRPKKFLDQQFFGTHSSFGPTIFWDPKFFWTTNCFQPIFSLHKIFWLQNIFGPTFFLTQNLLLVKLTLTNPI